MWWGTVKTHGRGAGWNASFISTCVWEAESEGGLARFSPPPTISLKTHLSCDYLGCIQSPAYSTAVPPSIKLPEIFSKSFPLPWFKELKRHLTKTAGTLKWSASSCCYTLMPSSWLPSVCVVVTHLIYKPNEKCDGFHSVNLSRESG